MAKYLGQSLGKGAKLGASLNDNSFPNLVSERCGVPVVLEIRTEIVHWAISSGVIVAFDHTRIWQPPVWYQRRYGLSLDVRGRPMAQGDIASALKVSSEITGDER